MEFYKNFQQLVDSNKLTPAGIAELQQHLEFDGFDVSPETDNEPDQCVEIRCYRDNWDVIEHYSPDLFKALVDVQASCYFNDEAYFEELQSNDGFFSYEIEGIIFIV